MYSSNQTSHVIDIEIRDSRKLHELQEEFSSVFPYLKIEFFKTPHRIGEASSRTLLHDQNKRVSDCRMKKSEGLLHIKREMTVSQFEAKLYDEFGLSAQVFRKSGNVWLETSATDAWTLAQQNEEGAELSCQIREERTNPDDTDLY